MPRKPQHSPAYRAVENAFLAELDELEALRPGRPDAPRRLLLACSAGGDSMALLDLCARVAGERHWRLAVAHVDHAQRAESAAEAHFVAEQAGGRGLEAFVTKLVPGAGAATASEDHMRQARHAVLRQIAARWEPEAIVQAHQADDVAETMLMRLLGGAGPTGLAGIQPVSRIDTLTFVRPLLRARRADLRQYLRERELGWHDDPSNEDPVYQRNWIRLQLLPMLSERLGYDPAPNMVRAAGLLASENAALENAAHLLLDMLGTAPPAGALAALNLEHPAWGMATAPLRRQLLRVWLWRHGGQTHPPQSATVEQAEGFASSTRTHPKPLRSEGGRWLKRTGGKLLLCGDA